LACALNVPLWFITGTADQENYASSLVSESPLTKTIQDVQDIVTAHCRALCEAAVEMAAALGRFPLDWRTKVEIHCELPSAVARDEDKAIDADLKLLDKKLLSPQHACARHQLDLQEETDLTAQAEAMGWQPHWISFSATIAAAACPPWQCTSTDSADRARTTTSSAAGSPMWPSSSR
jgi:hypothetical protein